jgi:hypothetical protein
MKFRPQRGSLQETIAETVEVKDRAELLAVLQKIYAPMPVTDFQVTFLGYDARTGWDMHIVSTIEEGWVFGYTNGPL